VSWPEVAAAKITPGQFTIHTIGERIAQLGDVAAALPGTHQQLPTLA
jgi:DNA primase